jgi:hypothetical protein
METLRREDALAEKKAELTPNTSEQCLVCQATALYQSCLECLRCYSPEKPKAHPIQGVGRQAAKANREKVTSLLWAKGDISIALT